jgi:hypothetical protein
MKPITCLHRDLPNWLSTISRVLVAVCAISGSAPAQMASTGIKIGDAVEVVTGFGWTPARVVAVNGNSYRVLVHWSINPTLRCSLAMPKAVV